MELVEGLGSVSFSLANEEEESPGLFNPNRSSSALRLPHQQHQPYDRNSTSSFLVYENGGDDNSFLEDSNVSLSYFDYNGDFSQGSNNASFTSVLASAYSNYTPVPSSYAMYERFMDESRHWVQRVLVPLVMCVGVIGNSVSMVVLTRRKMRSSTNNYLTALAISDLLYLVFVFSLSLQHHPDIKQPRHWFYWQYFRYGLWFTDASSSTSIWLTVTFTIERYIAISHPIKGKVLCTVSRAKKVVIVVYLLCWLLTATTPHEWVVITRVKPITNQPYLTLDYSSLGQDSTYRHSYYWFTAVTFILLPLCLLVVFNCFLIQAVRRSKLQRRKMTMVSERDHYSHQQEHKITVMLIAVVILALICQMPTAVLLLYSTVYEPPQKTKAFAIMRGLGNIFNLLNAMNAAANFILYSAFSDKYRRTFLITFVPCFYHQQPLSHSFVASSDGKRYGTDSASIRSVSRRVSKASTSSPMALKSSPRVKPGSFRENGVGALDARVTLQYGFGRVKRSMNLSPLDAYVQVSNSDSGNSPSTGNDKKMRIPYSPNVRCRRDLQCFDDFSFVLPTDYTTDVGNHCQDTKEIRRPAKLSETEIKMDTDVIIVEGTTPVSLASSDENDPVNFKFIDEESLDLSRSPVSIRKPEGFPFGEENGGPHLPILASSESTGSSSMAAISPGSTIKSSDSSKETTILSPD